MPTLDNKSVLGAFTRRIVDFVRGLGGQMGLKVTGVRMKPDSQGGCELVIRIRHEIKG